ncbi:MAG: glycosyltransferase family 4 protein [Ilumatobacteraceae bacterium]
MSAGYRGPSRSAHAEEVGRELLEHRLLRAGMVCPYSLSVPGGVQAQVMVWPVNSAAPGSRCAARPATDRRRPRSSPRSATACPRVRTGRSHRSLPTLVPAAHDPALTEEEFDVLHLHEPFIPGPTQTATLLHTAPIIATFHSAGDSAAYRYLRRPVLAASHRLAHRVAVSKDAEELVKRYIGGEYEILFNGVELEQYREARPHPSEGPTIFFLGRHEERKGLDVLLAAMRQLPDDVRLWVAGTGPDTARLQAQYADDRRIEWLGRVSDADKVARLTGATVFCAPSLHGESFGVVLIEAMAAGTAIVASGLDGYRNVATDGVDAVLVEPGDVQALVDGLKRVLYDAELATG